MLRSLPMLSFTWLAFACLTTPISNAQQPAASPATAAAMEGATVEPYKSVGDVTLNCYVFYPADHEPGDRRAAIVFFFGGGWRSGTPRQFEQQCRYLASRGMVAITADYRVRSRHGTLAEKCVADATIPNLSLTAASSC